MLPPASIISSRRATAGSSDPCTRMEKSTTTNTMWKMSISMYAGLITAITAKTTEAAPRRPEKEMSSFCRVLPPKGAISRNTAAGRATRVRNRAMPKAGSSTAGMRDG